MTLDTKFDDPDEGEELPPEVIQDSDLTKRSKCGYYYFNLKHVGMNHIPNSVYAAMALFFQIQRKKLYEKKSKSTRIFVKQKIFGDNAMPLEAMGAKDLMDYLAFKTPESFGSAMANRWLMSIQDGRYAGKIINWAFDGQGYQSSNTIKQATANYYKFVLMNGAPITGFNSPHPFVIDLEAGQEVRKIGVRIPELRAKDGKVYIDDPTIWGFNSDFPDTERKPDLETSALVTLRVMTMDTLIRNNELFRLKARLGKVPDDLNYIIYRHFNATADEATEVTRTWMDVERVKGGIKTFLARREDFTPDHRFCNACPHNTVLESGEIACRQRKPGIKPTVPRQYFLKTAFQIEASESGTTTTLNGYVRRDQTRDLVARLGITMDGATAYISYHSEFRGLGFEARMLEAADERLKATGLMAKVDYPAYFEGTGQTAARQALTELGFKPSKGFYQKTY